MKFMVMRRIFKEWEKIRGGHLHLAEVKTFSWSLCVILHYFGHDAHLISDLYRKSALFCPDVQVLNCSIVLNSDQI